MLGAECCCAKYRGRLLKKTRLRQEICMRCFVTGATGFIGKRLVKTLRQMVEFAKAVNAGHVHHVNRIAAAGLYEGVFREDMFEDAEGLDHPYFMTQHESERIVRKECKQPWTV